MAPCRVIVLSFLAATAMAADLRGAEKEMMQDAMSTALAADHELEALDDAAMEDEWESAHRYLRYMLPWVPNLLGGTQVFAGPDRIVMAPKMMLDTSKAESDPVVVQHRLSYWIVALGAMMLYGSLLAQAVLIVAVLARRACRRGKSYEELHYIDLDGTHRVKRTEVPDRGDPWFRSSLQVMKVSNAIAIAYIFGLASFALQFGAISTSTGAAWEVWAMFLFYNLADACLQALVRGLTMPLNLDPWDYCILTKVVMFNLPVFSPRVDFLMDVIFVSLAYTQTCPAVASFGLGVLVFAACRLCRMPLDLRAETLPICAPSSRCGPDCENALPAWAENLPECLRWIVLQARASVPGTAKHVAMPLKVEGSLVKDLPQAALQVVFSMLLGEVAPFVVVNAGLQMVKLSAIWVVLCYFLGRRRDHVKFAYRHLRAGPVAEALLDYAPRLSDARFIVARHGLSSYAQGGLPELPGLLHLAQILYKALCEDPDLAVRRQAAQALKILPASDPLTGESMDHGKEYLFKACCDADLQETSRQFAGAALWGCLETPSQWERGQIRRKTWSGGNRRRPSVMRATLSGMMDREETDQGAIVEEVLCVIVKAFSESSNPRDKQCAAHKLESLPRGLIYLVKACCDPALDKRGRESAKLALQGCLGTPPRMWLAKLHLGQLSALLYFGQNGECAVAAEVVDAIAKAVEYSECEDDQLAALGALCDENLTPDERVVETLACCLAEMGGTPVLYGEMRRMAICKIVEASKFKVDSVRHRAIAALERYGKGDVEAMQYEDDFVQHPSLLVMGKRGKSAMVNASTTLGLISTSHLSSTVPPSDRKTFSYADPRDCEALSPRARTLLGQEARSLGLGDGELGTKAGAIHVEVRPGAAGKKANCCAIQ